MSELSGNRTIQISELFGRSNHSSIPAIRIVNFEYSPTNYSDIRILSTALTQISSDLIGWTVLVVPTVSGIVSSSPVGANASNNTSRARRADNRSGIP